MCYVYHCLLEVATTLVKVEVADTVEIKWNYDGSRVEVEWNYASRVEISWN